MQTKRFLFALALLAASSHLAAPAAGASSCSVDVAGGLAMPQGGAGVCLTDGGGSTNLVLTTTDGILVLSLNTEQEDFSDRNADGTSLFHVYDRESRVIFCPVGLLDLTSGQPRPECLADAASLAPGPGALVGSGRLMASLVFDRSGNAHCPSAVHVVAGVSGAGGDALEVKGSLTLSPSGVRGSSRPRGWPACVTAEQEIRLSYAVPRPGAGAQGASLEADLAALGTVSAEEWNLLADLLGLGDTERAVLARLARLKASQAERLATELREKGAAAISPSGDVYPADEAAKVEGGMLVPQGILDQILANTNQLVSLANTNISRSNTIISKVDSLRSVTNGIDSAVNFLSARTPDRPDIRSLIDTFDLAAAPDQLAVGDVAESIERVGDLLRGVLDVFALLRDGFEAWLGNNCDPSSPCAGFKGQLASLFASFGDGSDLVGALACLDKPGLAIKPLDTTFLTDLVDKAPKVSLFGMSKALDKIAPVDPNGKGWPTLLSDAIAEIPAGLRADIAGLCGGAGSPPGARAGARVGGSGGPVCGILRRSDAGLAFSAIKGVTSPNDLIVKIVNHFVKEDLDVQVTVVAVGGAGGGFNVVNPPKTAMGVLDKVLQKVSKFSEEVLEKRDKCLESDADIESDLRQCSPPVSVYMDTRLPIPDIPSPTWDDVDKIVGLRLSQVEQCQDVGGCQDLDPTRAQARLDDARANPYTVAGYRSLSFAYAALTGGNRTCP